MKNKEILIQLMRFAVVGVVAAIVDIGMLVFLKEVLNLGVLVSSTVSFSVSVVVNYILSMTVVFKGGKYTKSKEFMIFVLLNVGGFGINQLIIWIGAELLSLYYIGVKIFAMIFVTMYNFVTRKIFLENNGK